MKLKNYLNERMYIKGKSDNREDQDHVFILRP